MQPFSNPFDTTTNTDYSPVDQQDQDQPFINTNAQLPQEDPQQQQQQQQVQAPQQTRQPITQNPQMNPHAEVQGTAMVKQAGEAALMGAVGQSATNYALNNTVNDQGKLQQENQIRFDAENRSISAWDNKDTRLRSYADYRNDPEAKNGLMWDTLSAGLITYLLTGDSTAGMSTAFNFYADEEDRSHRNAEYDDMIASGYDPHSVAQWIETGDADKLTQRKMDVTTDELGRTWKSDPTNPNNRFMVNDTGMSMYDGQGREYLVKYGSNNNPQVLQGGQVVNVPLSSLMSTQSYNNRLAQQQQARIQANADRTYNLQAKQYDLQMAEKLATKAEKEAEAYKAVVNETSGAYALAAGGNRVLDSVLSKPDALQSLSGLSSRLPSVRPETIEAEGELSQMAAKLYLNEIPRMKGTGSISNAEGAKLSNAASSLFVEDPDNKGSYKLRTGLSVQALQRGIQNMYTDNLYIQMVAQEKQSNGGKALSIQDTDRIYAEASKLTSGIIKTSGHTVQSAQNLLNAPPTATAGGYSRGSAQSGGSGQMGWRVVN